MRFSNPNTFWGIIGFAKDHKMSKIRFGTDPSKSLLCIRMCLPVLICCSRRNEGYCSLTEATTNISQFHELTIPVDSQAIGKPIAGMDIPHAGMLISIQRQEETIPRGDTVLYGSNKAIALCESEFADPVKESLRFKQDSSS